MFPALINPTRSPRCLLSGTFLIYLLLAGVAVPTNAETASDFSVVLNETAPRAHTITTDQEAMTVIAPLLVETRNGPGAVPRAPSNKPRNTGLSDELVHLGIQFIREIAIFQWALQFQNILEKESLITAQSNIENRQAFFSWLKSKQPQPDLDRVLSLTRAFLELSAHPRTTNETGNGYHEFAQHLLEQYPHWTGSDSAWLGLAEKEGASGILQRLDAYWKTVALTNDPPRGESIGSKDAYIGRFLQQQVIPIAKIHLEASLVRLQTQSEHRAWKAWQQIHVWKTRQYDRQNLTRLCGTWQWLIHNHQNHGDHKTIMVYPPPSQYDRMDPKPAKVQIQGDTVYIRWEFPNGIIQEESLLLSEKDRMLSGTFLNNMGPNGNITGRRIAPCKAG